MDKHLRIPAVCLTRKQTLEIFAAVSEVNQTVDIK